jgi:uncharacterized Zn finger protein (UPF0148 family)
MPVCHCSKCGPKSFEKDGRKFPGQQVSNNTKVRHQREDELEKMRAEAKEKEPASSDESEMEDLAPKGKHGKKRSPSYYFKAGS